MHYRWFNKLKPAPKWLRLELSDQELNHELRHHPKGTRWRMTYYRALWRATPMWANRERTKAVYHEAFVRRQAGEDVEVDHIIPLHGPLVCGLHVHTNLCVMHRKMNAQLSNKEYPGCPQAPLFENLNPYFELT